jgi:hypothetical protein
VKPHLHSKNHVKMWGGRIEDYLEIDSFIDSSKSAHADMRHRAVLHSAFGIYIVEQVFSRPSVGTDGQIIRVPLMTNSDGAVVHVRDIAEQHVLQDLGKIPALTDYLRHMELAQWMGGPVPRAKRNIARLQQVGVGRKKPSDIVD